MTNSARLSGRPSSSAAYNVGDVVDTPDSAIKSWRYLGAGEWEPNDAVRYTMGPGVVVRLSVEGESLSMAMTRGPLKVGPNIPPSTALEIDSISQTAPTNTTEAADTVRFKTGEASVRLTSSTAGGTLQATVSTPSITSSRWGSWVYVHDWTAIDYIELTYGQGASGYTDSLRSQKYFPRYNGWHYIESAINGGPNALQVLGAGNPANPVVRARVMAYAKAGATPDLSWDSIYYDGRQLPDVMVIIDDGESTGITQSAFTAPCDYAAGLGIPLTLAIFGSAIGLSEGIDYAAQYGTLGMLRRAYDQGHEFVVHGQWAYNGGQLGSYESVLADITANRNWLVGHGFMRGADHLVYPIGSYGQESYIDQAVSAAGIKSAREVYRKGLIPSTIRQSDEMMKRYWIMAHNATTDTVSSVKADIDAAIAGGMHACMMFHKFGITGGGSANDAAIADMWEILDYLSAKQKAGLLQCVTMSEFYNRRAA